MSDSRTALATRVVREQIFSGRLAQGSRLSEVRLAKELELSRGPVREALRTLEREGIVTFIAGQGSFVARVDPVQFREVIELRRLLEPLALELSITRRSHAIAGPLLAAVRGMRERVDAGSTAGLSMLHARFHATLYEQAGHQFLARIWKDLEVVLVLEVNSLELTLEQAREVVEDHERLADELIEADPVSGRSAILEHLSHAETLAVATPVPALGEGRTSRTIR